MAAHWGRCSTFTLSTWVMLTEVSIPKRLQYSRPISIWECHLLCLWPYTVYPVFLDNWGPFYKIDLWAQLTCRSQIMLASVSGWLKFYLLLLGCDKLRNVKLNVKCSSHHCLFIPIQSKFKDRTSMLKTAEFHPDVWHHKPNRKIQHFIIPIPVGFSMTCVVFLEIWASFH